MNYSIGAEHSVSNFIGIKSITVSNRTPTPLAYTSTEQRFMSSTMKGGPIHLDP